MQHTISITRRSQSRLIATTLALFSIGAIYADEYNSSPISFETNRGTIIPIKMPSPAALDTKLVSEMSDGRLTTPIAPTLQTEDRVVDEGIELSSESRFNADDNPWLEWDNGYTPDDEDYPPELIAVKNTRIKVTAKSYIAAIGKNVGNVPGGNNAMLNIVAGATDQFFSENPLNDRMDHAYRLYSSVAMVVTCDGNALLNWAHTPYLDDTGTEPAKPIANWAALQAPKGVLREEVTNPLRNTKGNFTRVNKSTLRIDWAFYGRPHPFAEPALTAVSPRTGKWIWHRVDGFVECKNDVAVPRLNISGSAFPSHRLWINRALTQTVAQGPFSNLWINGGEVVDGRGKSYKPKVLKVK